MIYILTPPCRRIKTGNIILCRVLGRSNVIHGEVIGFTCAVQQAVCGAWCNNPVCNYTNENKSFLFTNEFQLKFVWKNVKSKERLCDTCLACKQLSFNYPTRITAREY